MTTFEDLEFEDRSDGVGGVRAKHTFSNGYGASVILGPNSYGGDDGLYEVAVCHDGHLTYDTPITNDVIGHCSEKKVTNILQQIETLPSK